MNELSQILLTVWGKATGLFIFRG